MKRTVCILLVGLAIITGRAQNATDVRCIDFEGIPLEGRVDHFVPELKSRGYTEWGSSDDGEDLYFRGDYYGIRVRLMVSCSLADSLMQSALVTCGPYRTKALFERNWKYILYKLQQDYGEFSVRNGAYYYMNEYGMIKMSEAAADGGAREIKVFYYNTAPFYKDALMMGLRGNVQEVITENPVTEADLEHFARNGQSQNPDLTDRVYDQYGYLIRATMREESGQNSLVEYTYDEKNRLSRRTLTNPAAGIKYVNEYTYNGINEIVTQTQKVFNDKGDCILSINLKNSYEAHDDQGNWTRNTFNLVYWEKDQQSQHTTATQTRTISYYE